jgi:DNA sulfur modification protein DndC
MSIKQQSLWENDRMSLKQAIDLSISSLIHYGQQYDHWAIAYSGGKDSSATVAFVAWAILNNLIPRPKSLTVMYADTRQELPPLQATAMNFMDALRADGFETRVVLPKLDDRFYVYMLGRGVPPPKNKFRWCTGQLKVEPMQVALAQRRQEIGEKFLMLTGVRLGESAARDQRIAISCSKDSGECGQGWFQRMNDEAISDTLAPLLHWRLCFVWDWLYFAASDSYMQRTVGFAQPGHGYHMLGDIAAVYGDDEARTGCIACNLASKDTALENLIHTPEWAHLKPLMELKPLFKELQKARWRLRKAEPEVKKDGDYAKNGQRMGPLTMDARAYALDKVLDIQRRARIDLIDAEEEARIRQMWADGVFPNGWEGNEINADVAIDSIRVVDNELIVQPLML